MLIYIYIYYNFTLFILRMEKDLPMEGLQFFYMVPKEAVIFDDSKNDLSFTKTFLDLLPRFYRSVFPQKVLKRCFLLSEIPLLRSFPGC